MSFRKRIFGRLDERGTTAIEFAIIAPIFLSMIIGTVYMSMMLAVAGSMYTAVQQAARCASVLTTTCSDSASTISYAQSHYYGPAPTPTFTYNAAAACGHAVTGSVNYGFKTGTHTLTVPITATACFP